MIDGHRELYVQLGSSLVQLRSSLMLYDTRSSMLATLMFLCDYMNESKFVWLLWSLAL